MNDITDALTDAVADACARHPSPAVATDGSEWNAALWAALEQIGITLLTVPEEQGGAGGDALTVVAVLETLGAHSAAVPYAETTLQAGWLLAQSGAPVPDGPMSACVGGPELSLNIDSGINVAHGALRRVPWARHVEHVVVLAGRQVITLKQEQLQLRAGTNLAGEPRDHLVLDHVQLAEEQLHRLPEGSPVTSQALLVRGTVGRLALMAGAARRSLEMSIAYASERQQFGRSIGKFQAVQQYIAAMAGEVLLCKVAAEAAAQALEPGAADVLAVAAAKVAAGTAAGTVARLAHQIHGAIGFTEEHDLRLSTSRLWSWRDEFGSVRNSAVEVGNLALAAGADQLWSLLTGDRPIGVPAELSVDKQ